MVKRAALAFVVGLCVVRGLAGCGTPALLQCRVDAVRFLPSVPEQVSFGDVTDLVERLHACEAQGDAGR